MNATQAKRIVHDMVCKDCGRSLSYFNSSISREIKISCATPGCPCSDYVLRQPHGTVVQPQQISEKPTPKTEMLPEQARTTVADCVCSDCWEQLIETYNPNTRTSTVRCVTEGCECHGFVSRKWVEQREGQSTMERIEATEALRAAMPWMPKPKKSSILSELGF